MVTLGIRFLGVLAAMIVVLWMVLYVFHAF